MVKRSTITNTLAGILISTASNIYSQNRSIEFEKDTIWENTLEKAKKEDKLIFLDAYTDWCIPCKRMEKEVFTNDSVADFYNNNFINARINPEKSIIGKELANKYEIGSYPTFLFMDEKGELSYKSSGAMKSSKLIELGEKALKLEELVSEFEKNPENKTDGEAVYEHIQRLEEANLNYSQILDNYFKTQDDLTSKINWEIIRFDDTKEKIDSKHFEYLLKNKEKFDSLYTRDSVDAEIMNSFFNNLEEAFYKYGTSDSTIYGAWKEKVKKSKFYLSKELLLEGELDYSWRSKNWDKYFEDALLLDTIGNLSGNLRYRKSDLHSIKLNNMAVRFYENTNNEKLLEKALNWVERSIELEASWMNNDTRASILYSLGRIDEAIKIEETIIEDFKKTILQKEFPWILKDLEKQLEKMKKGEKIKK